MFLTDRSALITPQNATLDSLRTLSWFVSYRRLSSQFQFSLSAVTLGYLSQWFNLCIHCSRWKGRPSLHEGAEIPGGNPPGGQQQGDYCRQGGFDSLRWDITHTQPFFVYSSEQKWSSLSAFFDRLCSSSSFFTKYLFQVQITAWTQINGVLNVRTSEYESWILINIYTGGENLEQKRIPNNNITRYQSIKRVLPHTLSSFSHIVACACSWSLWEMAHRALTKFFEWAKDIKRGGGGVILIMLRMKVNDG